MQDLDSFRTPRLSAERLRPEHVDELNRLHRDPRVMATLGGLRSAAETRRQLRRNLGHWSRHGFGVWMFYAKSDGRFTGRAGLRHVKVGGRAEIELLYALRPEAWGRGLATEMAEAILALGYGDLGLADLVCFTLATNLASKRVMEKAGFIYERDVTYADLPHVLYRQGAAQWQARREGPA